MLKLMSKGRGILLRIYFVIVFKKCELLGAAKPRNVGRLRRVYFWKVRSTDMLVKLSR